MSGFINAFLWCMILTYIGAGISDLLNPRWIFDWLGALSITPLAIDAAAEHSWWGYWFTALTVMGWWGVWHNRPPPRDKRRVRKLIGAKARALRAKLVAAMPKPSPIPRPKLSPA